MRFLVCLCAWSVLAGCATAPTATPVAVTSPETPTITVSAPLLTPTATPDPNRVRIWWPETYAPSADTAGGQVLAQQLADFQQAFPTVIVENRVKQSGGPGGLLAALQAAYNAAPEALPNLVALSRDDLVVAQHAGLLLPLDTLVDPALLADYYPFAQAMSRVDNLVVGLPFAADARVLVYNRQVYATAPLTWGAVITGPFLIPAAETTGLTVLSTYLGLGGTLTGPTGQVMLDTELLAETLTLYQAVQVNGVLPLAVLTYTDVGATWQVFRERRAALAVTSAQWYLAEHNRMISGVAAALPTRDGLAFALADGWCWAMVNANPEQQPATLDLLRWLTASEHLSTWALAAQVLPPRMAAVQGWSSVSHLRFADDLLQHAQLQPSAEVLVRVGLPLRQALDDVLSGRATPIDAASTAARSLLP